MESEVTGQTLRFLTLTLRHEDETLAQMIDRLLLAFRRLRATSWWQSLVDGGLAVVEITHGADRHWHAHLHAITAGRFMPQAELAAQWDRASRGSRICDIRLLRGKQHLAYVTKYLGKQVDDMRRWDRQTLAEYIASVASRKTLITFGSWRKHKLTREAGTGEWLYAGSLETLRRKAQDGDDFAGVCVVLESLFWDDSMSRIEFDPRQEIPDVEITREERPP